MMRTDNVEPLSIVQVNSRLTGGGTDDQSAKLGLGLKKQGHNVSFFAPDGGAFAEMIQRAGIPIDLCPKGKISFILQAAKYFRQRNPPIVHAHHGRDYWPVILAAKLSGRNPSIVLTRHLAKSPSSWASRHFLLGRC